MAFNLITHLKIKNHIMINNTMPLKLGLFVCSFFMFSFLTTAQDIQSTNSELKGVTIYSIGANMKHTTPTTTIPSGISELVINQVARQLNPESIRIVSSNKNLTIQSVSFENDYLSSSENKSSSYLALKEKYDAALESLQYKTIELKSEESALSLLEANKSFGGNSGVTPNSISNMLAYYRAEYKKISNTITQLKKEETEQKKEVDNLAKQLAESGGENANAGQIVLTVFTDKEIKTDFDIEYYTQNVNWNPSYEIKVNSLNEPIDLVYNANVSQQTGVDWKQIPLQFSNAKPHVDNNIPQLSTWWISYMSKMNNQSPLLESTAVSGNAFARNKSMATVQESQLETSFVIETPYDIYTNKKPIAIELQNYKMPSEYTYYSIPAKHEAAFLLARISNWETYHLLPGEAQLIVDGQYAGKSFINPKTTDDKLEVSLGKDERIITKRRRIDEEGSKTSFLGSTQKRSYVYEIEIKNTRNEATSIEVKEQFPISTEKDIEVRLDKTSGANIDNEKGEMTWKIDLKPNETKTFKIGYTITYPKNKQLEGI